MKVLTRELETNRVFAYCQGCGTSHDMTSIYGPVQDRQEPFLLRQLRVINRWETGQKILCERCRYEK